MAGPSPRQRSSICPREFLIDDGVEDDARLAVDLLEDLLQLLFGADQRIDVLDGARILVLRRRRAPGREQRFARRVGDQMQMEEALRFVHRIHRPVGWCGQTGGSDRAALAGLYAEAVLSTIPRRAIDVGWCGETVEDREQATLQRHGTQNAAWISYAGIVSADFQPSPELTWSVAGFEHAAMYRFPSKGKLWETANSRF
jgi:hypothetical protein